jgi:hypothetical protein
MTKEEAAAVAWFDDIKRKAREGRRAEREQRRTAKAADAAAAPRTWEGWVNARIAAAVEAEHNFMIEILGEVVANIEAMTEKAVLAKVAEVRLDMTNKMLETLSSVERRVAGISREPKEFRFASEKSDDDAGKAADVPNFMRPRQELN